MYLAGQELAEAHWMTLQWFVAEMSLSPTLFIFAALAAA
jgi:hypothetical protein